MVVVASSGADSFITEGQVEEEVAHGLVGVPYHLAVVATRLSKAQRMMSCPAVTAVLVVSALVCCPVSYRIGVSS